MENKTPGLTVGQLRKALVGVPDETEIIVRGSADDQDDFCGSILGASVEHAHDEDDTPFFAIDCSGNPEDFEDCEEEE